jgi:hypothetical protein
MFHSKPGVAEPAAPPSAAQLPVIPLSVLALDLDVPVEGWATFLTGRGIEILTDDLGRASVARGDARQLFVDGVRLRRRAGSMRLRRNCELLSGIGSSGLRWVVESRRMQFLTV